MKKQIFQKRGRTSFEMFYCLRSMYDLNNDKIEKHKHRMTFGRLGAGHYKNSWRHQIIQVSEKIASL